MVWRGFKEISAVKYVWSKLGLAIALSYLSSMADFYWQILSFLNSLMYNLCKVSNIMHFIDFK